jgi:hypothetical protein
MGPRLRDDGGALAEALSRANEARDAHGTLRTLEVDDDGTFVTLGLRIDDETSVSVVLMFEVRSRGDARAPSPPMRRERTPRSRHSWQDERSGLVFAFEPHAREPRTRIADDDAFLRARVDSLRAPPSPRVSPHRPRAPLVATAFDCTSSIGSPPAPAREKHRETREMKPFFFFFYTYAERRS